MARSTRVQEKSRAVVGASRFLLTDWNGARSETHVPKEKA